MADHTENRGEPLDPRIFSPPSVMHFYNQAHAFYCVPTSMEDALGYGDEIAHDRQFHTRTLHSHAASGGMAGTQEGIVQGQGPGVDSAKDGLVEFCHVVSLAMPKS